MADKGGIQLLPETRKSIVVTTPGENKIIYFGIAVLAIVLAVYGGVWWYGNRLDQKLDAANAALVNLENERNLQTEGALLTLSQQMNTATQIVKNHTYWSQGLSKIEAALQNKVQFVNFSGQTEDNTFRFEAITDSYSTLARQLAAFVVDDSVEDITLDNVSIQTTGKLDVTAHVKFKPEKFLKKELK
ncbi:MAG TPA: hypothetical protein VG941_01495 [Candidatus Paceibacterota bacterium]|nr:hypothetical protein [Candidatus Paceibacterota bacterium]